MSNLLYWAKVNKNAIIPSKEDENAGYNFFAATDEPYILLKPNETKFIPTGIAWAAESGYYLQLCERSSTGAKGIKISAGIVDSGYRGEIKVGIFNATGKNLVFSQLEMEELKNILGDDFLLYSTKKAIAQGIVHKVYKMEEKEISLDELLKIPSKRGEKGWGSTNKV